MAEQEFRDVRTPLGQRLCALCGRTERYHDNLTHRLDHTFIAAREPVPMPEEPKEPEMSEQDKEEAEWSVDLLPD